MARRPGPGGSVVSRPGTGGLVGNGMAGVAAGLLVLILPPLFAVALVLGMAALAVVTRLARLDDIAAALLLVTAVTMPMNRFAVGPVPVSDLLLLAAGGLYALVRLVNREPLLHKPFNPILVGIGLLLAGGFLGTVFEAPGQLIYTALGEKPTNVTGWASNMDYLSKFFFGSLLPIGTWIVARPGRALMQRIVIAYFLGCLLSTLIGFPLPSSHLAGRLIGMTVHPNQFGSFCLIGVGVAVALVIAVPRWRIAALVSIPILVVGIVGSGSRAALGALLVLGLILGPLTRRRAVMGAVLTCGAVGLLVLGTGLVQPSGENALGRTFGEDSGSSTGSSEIRSDLGSQVFDRWTRRPLTGNGYSMMRPSHNVYLGVLSSAGVLGVAGLALIITTIVRRTWRRRADLFAACTAGGYLAYLANAAFDNIFWWRWLWFTVGMVVAVLATASSPDDRPTPAAGPAAPLGLARARRAPAPAGLPPGTTS